MEIPSGYHPTGGWNKAFKLRKALYRLKQSPRAWFGRFTNATVSLEYRQSQGGHTLFIQDFQESKLILLQVYVDDMIVTCDDEVEK